MLVYYVAIQKLEFLSISFNGKTPWADFANAFLKSEVKSLTKKHN